MSAELKAYGDTSMVQPSGQDALAIRRRYLKHRGHRMGDRGVIAGWVTVGAVMSWLFIAGFLGLGH